MNQLKKPPNQFIPGHLSAVREIMLAPGRPVPAPIVEAIRDPHSTELVAKPGTPLSNYLKEGVFRETVSFSMRYGLASVIANGEIEKRYGDGVVRVDPRNRKISCMAFDPKKRLLYPRKITAEEGAAIKADIIDDAQSPEGSRKLREIVEAHPEFFRQD